MGCEDKMRWQEIELFLKFVKGITVVEYQSIQNRSSGPQPLPAIDTHLRSTMDSSLVVSCQLLEEQPV